MPFVTELRHLARRVHPARLRFLRFTKTLPLDPDQLPVPLEMPGQQDFMICGCPRTGTSLLAAMLHQPPHVITVTEPWDGFRLPPADLFRSLRNEIELTGRLTRGTLDIEQLVTKGKVKRCREEQVSSIVPSAKGWLLGVKSPNFHRYIELLPQTRFLVCLRHPIEVITSFARMGGSLHDGLDYPIAFNRKMNETLARSTRDRALRRIAMFDYIHEQLLPLLPRENVLAVRYERWFQDRDALMGEIAHFLGVQIGKGPAKLERPERGTTFSSAERDLIVRNCRTAAPLGYAFEPS